MSNDFFLDGDYSDKQINALNYIKLMNTDNSLMGENVSGSADSIFDDINSYQNDKTKQTDNTELFNYIEKTMGMDNFLELLDADGDGKISKSEANKMSSYDGDDKLSNDDINKIIDNAKKLKNASTTKDGDNFDIKFNYETNSEGQLVKTSAVKTDNKTKTEAAEYTYDENGNIESIENKLNNRTTKFRYQKDSSGKYIRTSATEKNTKTGEITAKLKYDEEGKLIERNDKLKNRTTKYEYDTNGKKKSSKTTANQNKNILMYESTYDENGRENSRKEYFNLETGQKADTFSTYTYDEYGRLSTRKIYEGSDDKGKLIGDYEYGYATDKFSTEVLQRKDKVSGITREYTYNEDHEVTEKVDKDKDGKTIRTMKMNKDGTVAFMTEDQFTYIYEYKKGGIISKTTKYDKSDVDNDGKPKSSAKPKEEITYKDGTEDKKTVYDSDGTKYYQGGELKAEVKGEYTYVYEYDSKGNKTEKKYSNSDCVDGVPKPGATPIVEENNATDDTNNNTDDTNNNSSSSTATTSINPTLAQNIDARLGNGFCAEVEKLAEQMKCDAEDILVMMYSESGLDPHAGDGSFSAGLTQFIAGCEPTVDGYTPSIAELNNMSALEQMKYIAPDLISTKTQLAGLPADAEVDTGTLYAINFLPAFAGNEVLCSAGDIYYNSNSPLDFDGDGQITKTDLANHLNKKRAEMYADFGL